MPAYNVDSDKTEETSGSLTQEFNEFTERLQSIKNKVDALISDGYSTPAAEKHFRPFFEDFNSGFEDVNKGLEGIAKYLKQVGTTFSETDEKLGEGLKG
ncbi:MULTISPECIES: WXG100 family type VII secretion target [Nocardiopsis]|uniref:WXG100 family type VII secretion target n=1 Tax=Nocardiopsis TaxID=2013 RepID=UPI00034D0779|nr:MULTISPECIES: WXG100 family type VII secretion target [Nocardiopsis]PWV45728.1 WXG100 family type VII secretion target [Nocardiopsis sp. L17-MgMaSL7]